MFSIFVHSAILILMLLSSIILCYGFKTLSILSYPPPLNNYKSQQQKHPKKHKEMMVFKQYQSKLDNNDMNKRSLVIWDCDGVLVDSEALLKQGEIEALAKHGFNLSIDDCVRLFSGVSVDKAESNFISEYNKPLPTNFFKEQIAGSMDLFKQRLQPLMYNTVRRLHEQKALQCVASGSPKDRVELCIDVANMRDFFASNNNRIFTRELVKNGKPAPDLFLYSAKQMGYEANQCLVIEDSKSGIEAALAANMEVLAYLGGGHAQAEWYIESIKTYQVPIVYTEDEVYDYINARLL